jgi:BirA family biotin operon repressor/biotin-[acetyl-CoA-carboxylase] ligase
VLLRPRLARARWSLLPLLAGVVLADAIEARTALPVRLKWPNDVLAPDGSKLAGILVEVSGEAVVVGFGVNVSSGADELPPGATSLALAGARDPDRDPLLRAILRELDAAYRRWDGGLPASYVERCETIGRRVRLELPGGSAATGTAVGVDGEGRLLIRSGDGTTSAHAAGDVVHVRQAD